MPVRSLKDGTVTLMDNTGTSVVLDVEEGDFSFVKHQPANFISDRGVLHSSRLANEQYYDISFSMIWQTLSTHASTTPYDALTKSGGASGWASVGPTGSDYAVGVIFEAADADTTAAEDDVFLFKFYPQEISISEGDPYGMINVSGVGYTSLPFGANHEWLLNETSGTRVDNIGSLDFTDVNTVLYGTGKEGNAADFEGSPTAAKEVLLATGPVLVRGTAFTWLAFVKPESHEAVKYCLCHSYDLNLRFLAGVPEVFGQDTITTAVGTTTLSTGTWYSVGMVYNGVDTVWPIVNGVKEGSGGAVGSGTFNDPGNGVNSVRLGHVNGSDGNYYWDGLIDVCMMWKTRALSDTEILAYHNYYA